MSGDVTPVTPREYLKAELAPLLDPAWRLVPYQRMPNTIDATTVVVKTAAFEPHPAAPIGSIGNELTVTVAAPFTDREQAEDELDVAVLELVAQLDALLRVQWTGARKVLAGDFLAWDVTIQLRTDKE